MLKYLILILLSLSIILVSCDNKNPEETKKEQASNQEATDNFESLVEQHNDQSNSTVSSDSTNQASNTNNSDTLKTEPESINNSKPIDYSKKPLEGEIIAISDLGTGNYRKMTKDLAKQLVNNGEILAVKSIDKVYFVYNADGSLASKKLASFANNSKVMMTGKSKVIDDMNIFILDLIEGK